MKIETIYDFTLANFSIAAASDMSELVAGGVPNTGENDRTSPLCESHIVPLMIFNLNKALFRWLFESEIFNQKI